MGTPKPPTAPLELLEVVLVHLFALFVVGFSWFYLYFNSSVRVFVHCFVWIACALVASQLKLSIRFLLIKEAMYSVWGNSSGAVGRASRRCWASVGLK